MKFVMEDNPESSKPIENSGDKQNAEALSQLLDNALQDFNKKKTADDDDLDDFMEKLDAEAAQKAAKEFNHMLQQMVQVQEQFENDRANQANQVDVGSSSNDEETAFRDGIQKLLQCSSEMANASDQNSLFAALEKMSSSDPGMNEFMNAMMSTVLSKEFMYPPLHSLLEKFGPYMEENKDKLSEDELEKYRRQQELLTQLCAEYEKDTPDEGNEEQQQRRAETIATLWQDLHKLGYPPAELIGDLPPGWDIDPQNGMPKVEDPTKVAQDCCIM